jgi:hypothetical protein
MRVDRKGDFFHPEGFQKRSRAGDPGIEQESLWVADAELLKRALKQVPEVRAERVEEAKILVANPSYPQESVLSGVAELLSRKLEWDNE